MARRKEKLITSLETALKNRVTIREITGKDISIEKLNSLIWAAYANTHRDGQIKMRTAPSAGATYPVEIYLAVERVEGLSNGIYRYDTKVEQLRLTAAGSYLGQICSISLDQDFIPLSNAAFIRVYNPARIENKYDRDSKKYALLECGHIAQNILLAATAMNLGAVPVGAFYENKMADILKLRGRKKPVYMICVGTID